MEPMKGDIIDITMACDLSFRKWSWDKDAALRMFLMIDSNRSALLTVIW